MNFLDFVTKPPNFYEQAKMKAIQGESIETYTPLSYIEASGANRTEQYIITDWVSNDKFAGIDCTFASSGAGAIFAALDSPQWLNFHDYYYNGANRYKFSATPNNQELLNVEADLTEHTLIVDNQHVKIDNLVDKWLGSYSITVNYKMFLFACNYGDNVTPSGMDAAQRVRIKTFTVYEKEDGNIYKALDMYACIRDSDNKPGMYDKISKTFYPSSGAVNFIPGAVL